MFLRMKKSYPHPVGSHKSRAECGKHRMDGESTVGVQKRAPCILRKVVRDCNQRGPCGRGRISTGRKWFQMPWVGHSLALLTVPRFLIIPGDRAGTFKQPWRRHN
ncbi:Fast Kinase Domain-Containing Protein 4 [Manis pentadactyla]|nr:Fast Kinase Domain-Containing Protein 4 [Manis pentadactyla]